MRTLMLLASLILIGVGTFCMANSAVPFVSVAFIVGIAVLFLGLCELLVSRASQMRTSESNKALNAEWFIAVLLGIVFLSGQVTEGNTVASLFALWATSEGVRAIANSSYDIKSNSSFDNMLLVLGIVTTLYGVYVFFNNRVLNLPTLIIVGIGLFLIGLNRFKVSLEIEYKAPEFLTGNQEKLHLAKQDEKRAMQKAKAAIKETKDAQRRIASLSKEIAKEEALKHGMKARRSAKKD